MSERTEYAAGTPSWVDNASPDPGAAAEFYSGLFGWQTEDVMPAEEAQGEYHMATLRGKRVAALGSQPMDGPPPAWNTYVRVDDADATAEAVKSAGGNVVMEPFDIFDSGRMAVFADPAGAVFMCWQPKEMIGAELVNEPGTFSWSELHTPDPEGSKQFYASVFGWKATSMAFAGGEYTIWHNTGGEPVSAPADQGGTSIGGMMSNENSPEGTPPFWMVYFNVEDADATVAKAEQLGGSVIAPALDAEGVGRIAVLADPQGAAFSVITPVPTD
jgi:predicted enzyme related to lactoylglutathione lyase